MYNLKLPGRQTHKNANMCEKYNINMQELCAGLFLFFI